MRLTPQELARLWKAAGILWPGAPVTQSGMILGLARLMADSVLKHP